MSLCGTDGQTTNKQVKIELLSRWKLEAEFRNSSNGEVGSPEWKNSHEILFLGAFPISVAKAV